MKKYFPKIIALTLVLLFVMAIINIPDGKSGDNDSIIKDTDGSDYVSSIDPIVDTDDQSDQTPDNLIADVSGDKETDKDDEVGKNPFINEDNEITEPLDKVYPDEFEDGEFDYDAETIMIKFKPSFDGNLTKDLKKAGITAMDHMMSLESGVWYKANVKGEVTEVMENVRAMSNVIVAEYNFQYQASSTLIDCEHPHDKIKDNHNVKDQWYIRSCGVHKTYEYQIKNDLPLAGEGTVVAVIDTGVDFDHIDLAANMWKNTGEVPDNGIDDDNNGYIDDYYGVDVIEGKGNGNDDHGHGTHVAGIIAAANNKEGIVGIAYNSKIMAVKAGMASGVFNQSDVAEAIIYAYENGADVINMSFGGSASSIAVQDALELAYSRCVLVAAAGNDGTPNENYLGNKLPVNPSYPAALKYVLGVMSVGQGGVESSFTNFDGICYTSAEYELYAPGEEILSTIPNNKYASWNGTSMAAPVVSAAAAMLRASYEDRESYPTKFIYGQLAGTSETGAVCGNFMHGPHNIPSVLDVYAATTKLPTPDVNYSEHTIFDTEKYSEENNEDGIIDAGETIAIGLTLSNRWGMSKDSTVTIDSISEGGVANPYVKFIVDGEEKTSATLNYGSVGTYSDKDAGKLYENDMFVDWEDPFIVKISKECPNDYIIKFNVNIESRNGLDEKDKAVYSSEGSFDISVRRGKVLPNKIEEDMTLTADNTYIIPSSTIIMEGATVTVEAGTNIQFWTADPEDPYAETGIAYLQVEGKLFFEGTPENRIRLYPSELMSEYVVQIYEAGTGRVSMKYCDVVNPYLCRITNSNRGISYAYGCEFGMNYNDVYLYTKSLSGTSVGRRDVHPAMAIGSAEACSFRRLCAGGNYARFAGIFTECIFTECTSYYDDAASFIDCVFWGNNASGSGWQTAKSFDTFEFKVGEESLFKVGDGVNSINTFTGSDGTRYVGVWVQGSFPYNNSLNALIVQAFAESLGGSIACFETEEEWELFREYDESSYDKIGLIKDVHSPTGYSWINGESCGEFLLGTIKDNGSYYLAAINLNHELDFAFSNDLFNGDLWFEFPADAEGFSDMEDFRKKWNEFIDPMPYPGFTGNAIINRTATETNVERWFRPKAAESSIHATVSLAGNYWGTTNEELINKQIIDFDDFATLADIDPSGYLTEAPEDVWPFVVNAGTLVDGKEMPIVGNEEVTFFVEFNRDMDIDIPLHVTFGSTYPYADYVVEGKFVSPRRWEGTTTLKTTIENGTQYLSISNGKAVDEHGYVYEEITEPTCTEQGYTTYTCICGQSYKDDFVAAKGHVEVIDEAVSADCINSGLTEGKHCSECGEIIIKQLTVPALGHEYADDITESDCENKGYTTHTCSRCEDVYSDTYVNAHGHIWTDWVKAESVEGEAETEERNCDVCGETDSRNICTQGHEIQAEVTPATCTEQGYTTYSCDCGYSYKDDFVAAVGHMEVTDEAIEATCTETGLTEGKHCSECNEVIVKQQFVSALGHKYTDVTETPDCDSKGYTTHTCSECGDEYTDAYVNALGHTWGEWTHYKAQNGGIPAQERMDCTECYANEIREVPVPSHMKLYEDWGRFTFEIDTTEALAMIMQGSADETGISLSWHQDDFDTLAGYNVYRSTSEDGYYQRLNDVMIPSDTKEFFDETVEPGVVYYYNFTVVQTDLTESVPSGKITIRALDTMLPTMYHTPVYQAFTGSNLVISAMVTDNVAVQDVKLYYRVTGDTEYKTLSMTANNDKYSAVIPSAEVTTAGIEYYISAFDGVGYTNKGTSEDPYSVLVQLAVDPNSKGDVDGDGVISNKDALMLLQAVNDLLNLDAEQFARADIDDDNELTAAEALRILQYVSGKITSILF